MGATPSSKPEVTIIGCGTPTPLPDRFGSSYVVQIGDEKLLFVFNLTREPVEFPIPKAMRVTDILPMPGFAPLFDAGIVTLEGLDVFCGVVA